MNRLLLEIRTEEIPAGYIKPALDALAQNFTKKLTDVRIRYGKAQTYGTPRRLALSIDDVADRQQPITQQILGPPERIAYDIEGRPTVPAQKFAEKVGVAVQHLSVTDTEKGRYLCATIMDKGSAVKPLLQKLLPEAILAIPFPKTMRWSDMELTFARPIHSIVALLGSAVISFTLNERFKSGRYTWGHMFMHPQKVKICDADGYLDTLRQVNIIADMDERKRRVEQEVTVAAQRLEGRILPDDDLLNIVTNLVEYPVAAAGYFDAEFLELPDEVLITAMREHQKYFAVVDEKNRLMPCFVAVNNTRTKDMDLVTKGHERVLRARLSDAQFFFRSDLKENMDAWGEKLGKVMFQAQLGSMQNKVHHVIQIATYLAERTSPELVAWVKRAAELCKTDLVSQMVIEFPKLQGIMGRIYATAANEPEEVATAIEEHYQPTYSGGSLPETLTGALLAVADKLGTICACFSIGLIPTGATDPYALRRQGIGIVQISLKHQLSFSLSHAIAFGIKQFEGQDQPEGQDQLEEQDQQKGNDIQQAIYTFIRNRINRILAEQGYAKDLIFAVTSVSIDHIPNVRQRVAALQKLKNTADFESLAVAFKRVVNILRKAENIPANTPDIDLFQKSAESGLYDAARAVKAKVDALVDQAEFDQALGTIATLRAPVDRFFEDVMVITDDLKIRQNRLALLNYIAVMFNQIADFSKIAT